MTRPAFSACLIAKNERENVEQCLTSFADHVDEIVFVDTGSRDGTVAEVRRVAREHGWKLVLGRLKSTCAVVEARNYAESLATGEFVVNLDLDERVIGAEYLRTACMGMTLDIGSMRAPNAFLYEYRGPAGRWIWRQRVTHRGVFPFISATERQVRGGVGIVSRKLCHFVHHSRVSARPARRRPRVVHFVDTQTDHRIGPTAGARFSEDVARSLARWSRETTRLADGTLGYYPQPAWRADRCLATALATLLQVPLEEVPDSRVDERLAAGERVEDVSEATWALYIEWLASRGLELVKFEIYPDMPVPRDRWIDANHALSIPDRWIGVLRQPGYFQDHVVVMSGKRLLFDAYGLITRDDDPCLHLRLYYGLSVKPHNPSS